MLKANDLQRHVQLQFLHVHLAIADKSYLCYLKKHTGLAGRGQ